MGLIAGTKLGAYEIRSALGAGGMGEVYRATDTKLGRDVALKVLPAEMAEDAERLGRFRREAKVLAQLDHPNIVTIYSVEESDGVHFLTMQLVEGLPLDRLITQSGLPVEQIVEIAEGLAEALAAAHEKGIVHRDLKPANVMVTNEGRVKVLDFGLAKDVRGSSLGDATMTSDSRTQVGVVMGTPAYMSPEQTSGRPLDHRTDIFSLGVLLFEMSTGKRPFEGSSSAELVSAILRDTPPSVTDSRPDLPSDLARIIRRCLEKDPRRRVQTARDVSNEFRELARNPARPVSLPSSTGTTSDSGTARADEGFWVAVLPFKYSGTNADLAALAEGLSDEIVTGLSRFPYLRVIARGSTAKYSSESGDVRAIGKELGARYVMEGSLRQAGTTLRIAVQVVDASTGAHLWAQTYERTLRAEDVFAVQDDVADRVVATVGDANGVLVRSIGASIEEKPEAELTALDWTLRCLTYRRNVTAEVHASLREGLERFVEHEPKHADTWGCLALLYCDEFTFGFNPRPDALGRSLAAARRSIKIDRTCQMAHNILPQIHFYRRDVAAFRAATEDAIALNPRNTEVLGQTALLLVFSREGERGVTLARRAMDLNPLHPGWYHVPLVWDYFHKGEYEKALEHESRINIPGLFWQPLAVAACCGMLGRKAEAVAAAEELRQLDPEIELHLWRHIDTYNYASGFMDRILEGLAKAGLQIVVPDEAPPRSGESKSIPARTASGEARTDEGFWVAVLPFKYTGANEDLKALAGGLTEEVITGLSRFSYLRVIARGSTAKYSSESGDVRAIGRELGARYVMEGSLRQAGSKLRLAVQLADTVSGAHLWAETYERGFRPESIFELQDDLIPRIVSTVADQHGVLPRSMGEVLRKKNEDSLTPHEASLRAFSYFTRLTPEEHATTRRILESAVQKAPDHADCWAMLSLIYIVEYSDGYNALPDPLGRALAAADRAVDLAPTHSLGHYAAAFVYFFRKEKAPFLAAVDRAVALNPMDGTLLGLLGMLLHHAGDEERGLQMAESGMQLNPNYPGILRFTAFSHAYVHGKYEQALEAAVRINMPGFFYAHACRAAALGQLGQREAAHKAVQDLLALRSDFASTARHEFAKWWKPEQVEHLVEGLRKAGLEIPEREGTVSIKSDSDRSATPQSRASHKWAWVAGLALIVVLGLAWFLRPTPPLPQVTGTTQLTRNMSWPISEPSFIGIDPIPTDGTRIYFGAGDVGLAQVSTEGGEPAPVPVPSWYYGLHPIAPNRSELLIAGPPIASDGLRASVWTLPLPAGQPRRLGNMEVWDAAWSRDGATLYYGMDGAIFAADADGNHGRNLLAVPGDPFWIRESPDGRLLRFSLLQNGKDASSLWEARTNGGDLHRLLPGFTTQPSDCCGNWTPDGRYYIFQATRNGVTAIWAMRDAGDWWHRVSHAPVQLTPDLIRAERPEPSRDGKRIFFVGTKQRGELTRYDPKTKAIEPFLPGVSGRFLTFTRDGRHIAWISWPEGKLWYARSDGTDQRQLTFAPMEADFPPSFSPDGTEIAFVAHNPGSYWQVYIVPVDGGEAQPITQGNVDSEDATWSPSGDALAYGPSSVDAGDAKSALRIVNLRTHETTEVPGSKGLFSARWSPAGRYLVALTANGVDLMLYDFNRGTWQTLTSATESPASRYGVDSGKFESPNWSADGKCVYFAVRNGPKELVDRICLADRKVTNIVDLASGANLVWSIISGKWSGVGPDGSLYALRDISNEEIYALDMKFP